MPQFEEIGDDLRIGLYILIQDIIKQNINDGLFKEIGMQLN